MIIIEETPSSSRSESLQFIERVSGCRLIIVSTMNLGRDGLSHPVICRGQETGTQQECPCDTRHGVLVREPLSLPSPFTSGAG